MNKNVHLLLRVIVKMTLVIYLLTFPISQRWLYPVGGMASWWFTSWQFGRTHQNAVFLCVADMLWHCLEYRH